MITLTHEQLDRALPYATDEGLIKYLPLFNKHFEKYKVNTLKRAAAFLAQIAEESGSLRYVEEIASGSAYEYRKDLGNLDKEALAAAHKQGTTTGRFYKG